MKLLPYILATAGHVDHGKSSLVRALTGIDPSRHPEERARGITIDLGFAHLLLDAPADVRPDARLQVGVIDVPGHEDFVKNMVAGTGSVDAALLVVAADDGWMPQTEEHLQILQYLGVRRGVVAVTKIDLATDEDAAVAAVRAKLAGTALAEAAVVPTSVPTGRGIDALRAALAAALAAAPPQEDVGKPRLPIDRLFVLKGVGTIVTGTLGGGTLKPGDAVAVQPGGFEARLRSVQSYNREVMSAAPGSRVAANVPELNAAAGGTARVGRGSVVTLARLGSPAQSIDVMLERSARGPLGDGAREGETHEPALKDGARVHVHHGSGTVAARVRLLGRPRLISGERCAARLAFETPIFAFVGDRLLVRDWPGRHTLAGGLVLDVRPAGQRRATPLRAAEPWLAQRAAAPRDAGVYVRTEIARVGWVEVDRLLVQSRFSEPQIRAAAEALAADGTLVRAGAMWVDGARWSAGLARAAAAVDAWHKAHPEQPGLALAELRVEAERAVPDKALAAALVDALAGGADFTRVGTSVRRRTHRPALPAALMAAGARVRAALSAKPLEPPARNQVAIDPPTRKALQYFLDTGEAVALGEDVVLLGDAVERATDAVRAHLRQHGRATASELKTAVGTTRRVMMPLLEYLDRAGVTLRQGDWRTLRGSGSAASGGV